MRIGIVCYPSAGGSGVVASDLGAALAARGHDVHFITYEVPFRLRPVAERFRFHRVEIPRYPLFEFPSYGMAVACHVAEVAKEHRLELVHAHYAYPHAVSALLARQIAGLDFKVVTTLHGTDIALVREDVSFRTLTCYALERSDAVTAVSGFLREQTLRWFGTSAGIEVIPNFVDAAEFRPRPRAFPDEIVHCGPAPAYVPYTDPGLPLALAVRDSIDQYIEDYRELPKVILMQNHGLIALGATALEVENVTAMYVKTARVLLGTYALGGPNFLSSDAVARIHTRPDEEYRRKEWSG